MDDSFSAARPNQIMLSLVIPVFNEEESLGELRAEIDRVAAQQRYDLEILFVDDGTTDRSWEQIRNLAAKDSRVRGIRFRRNFGKAAALNAGFRAASGDIILTLDADLQDDPAEIPNFLKRLDEGNDVVSGWKKVRHDPWHKVLPSRVFNWMVSRMTGVKLHDHNCGMKCYRRAVIDEVQLYGELHRFVPVLAAARGWKVGELVIQHRARKHGYSKYGVRRFVKGWHKSRERGGAAGVFIPLYFAPGEAYQFDWSHEVVEVGGLPQVVKVAHMLLCHSRVFLAIGRQNLDAFASAPQHHYLLRLVDPPTEPLPLPQAEAVIARGPFTVDGDRALLQRHRIDLIVAKNAGGAGAEAKLSAARELGLPVVLIDRPAVPERTVARSVAEVMAWLAL